MVKTEREIQLETALRSLLWAVEVFPPEASDARAAHETAAREAREAIKTKPARPVLVA